MDTRRIVFVVFPDFQILDLTGPHEVFAQAARLVSADHGSGIEIDTVAASGGQVRSSHGLSLGPVRDLDDHTAIDTLSSSWAGPAGSPHARTSASSAGSLMPRDGRAGSPRCAAARFCWPGLGCWTGGAP